MTADKKPADDVRLKEFRKSADGKDAFRYDRKLPVLRGFLHLCICAPNTVTKTKKVSATLQWEFPVGHFYDQVSTQHESIEEALNALDVRIAEFCSVV